MAGGFQKDEFQVNFQQESGPPATCGGGFQTGPFQLNYQQHSCTPTPTPGAGPGPGGGGWYPRGRWRRREHDLTLKKILEDVAAEVMYRELVDTPEGKKAAKIVKPFAETKKVEVPRPEVVNWAAVEQDDDSTVRLAKLWRKWQMDREIEMADEEWFLMGD